jgi:hypothetical protein
MIAVLFWGRAYLDNIGDEPEGIVAENLHPHPSTLLIYFDISRKLELAATCG